MNYILVRLDPIICVGVPPLLYLQNDVLGQVDNTHLALADAVSPFSADCLKLAEIHSVRAFPRDSSMPHAEIARLRMSPGPYLYVSSC